MKAILPILMVLVLLCGCASNVHFLTVDPATNRVIRTESDNKYFFDLEENATTGYMWVCSCDDPDVDVDIEHVPGNCEKGLVGAPGKAKVSIFVHRGYDGPSLLEFGYKRSWEKEPIKRFTIMFYRCTGDAAAWK